MAAKTILLVEPYESLGALVATILEEEGYRVTVVEAPKEAIQALRNERFDLVITEAFAQTRSIDFDPFFLNALRSAAGNAPIILFSTYVSAAILRAGDFGLAEVIAKPFNAEDLVKKVSKVSSQPPPPGERRTGLVSPERSYADRLGTLVCGVGMLEQKLAKNRPNMLKLSLWSPRRGG